MSEPRQRERPALDESDAARASGPARRVREDEDDSARSGASPESGAPRKEASVDEPGPESDHAAAAAASDDRDDADEDEDEAPPESARLEQEDEEPPPSSEVAPDSSPMLSGDAVWASAARSIALSTLLGFAVATFLKLVLAGSWVAEFLAENTL